jgi:hypothetical protein
MKTMKTMKTIMLLSIPCLMLMACEKDNNDVDNPQANNEEELITTLKLEFYDLSGRLVETAIFRDLDGDGGNPPSQWDTIRLDTQSLYLCQVNLLNEGETPADTITHEVEEEGTEHLVCFTPTDSVVNIGGFDQDENGLDLGLRSRWLVTDYTNSFVRITLKHQPDGLKDGTCNPGETDIEVTFALEAN